MTVLSLKAAKLVVACILMYCSASVQSSHWTARDAKAKDSCFFITKAEALTAFKQPAKLSLRGRRASAGS